MSCLVGADGGLSGGDGVGGGGDGGVGGGDVGGGGGVLSLRRAGGWWLCGSELTWK